MILRALCGDFLVLCLAGMEFPASVKGKYCIALSNIFVEIGEWDLDALEKTTVKSYLLSWTNNVHCIFFPILLVHNNF